MSEDGSFCRDSALIKVSDTMVITRYVTKRHVPAPVLPRSIKSMLDETPH